MDNRNFLNVHSGHILTLLQTALRTARLGIWEWDLETNRFQLDEEIMEILGSKKRQMYWSAEELISFIVPEDQERMMTSLQAAATNGFVDNEEYGVQRSDGKPCFVLVNSSHVVNSEDGLSKMVGIIQDVSVMRMETYRAEQAFSSLNALVNLIPSPIFYKDQEGVYRYCNQAFSDYLGLPMENIINHTVYDVAPPEMADVYKRADDELMESKGIQVYESKVKYADGSIHDVQFMKATQLDVYGHATGLVGVMLDITDRKQIERQMEEMDAVKDLLIDISHNIMETHDEELLYTRLLEGILDIISHAHGACLLTLHDDKTLTVQSVAGYAQGTLDHIKMPIAESLFYRHTKGESLETTIINDLDTYPEYPGSVKMVPLDGGQPPRSTMIVPIHIDGQLRYLFHLDSMDKFVYTASERNIAEYLRQQVPILSKIFELYSQTLNLSRYDSLTGFMNRRHFETVFDDRLVHADRLEYGLVLVLFDMDWLKQINDAFGHQAGDYYLVTFSEIMKANFRASDAFARIGGDEFTAIFTDSDFKMLQDRLEAIRSHFTSKDFQYGPSTFRGRFSYGMAQYPEDGESLEKLLHCADQRMYADKTKRKPAYDDLD